MTIRHEPIAIPHDFANAGLREWLPIATSPGPRRYWPWFLMLAFLLGTAFGFQLQGIEP